eukprot:6209705-Pleurochrysis_carterae.AAC.5
MSYIISKDKSKHEILAKYTEVAGPSSGLVEAITVSGEADLRKSPPVTPHLSKERDDDGTVTASTSVGQKDAR